MPRIGSLKPRKVISTLVRMGFFIDHQSGSHVVLYHNETRRRAVVPKHIRDVRQGTLYALLREAGIPVDDFIKAL